MFAELSRPYKERTAEDTVHEIRGILEKYDLLPQEMLVCNPYPGLHSSRIALPFEKGGFGTNGKGRTEEYCRASAYGEFIERLQNGACSSFSRPLQTELYREFGFYVDPREKFISLEDYLNLPRKIREDISSYNGQAQAEYVHAYFERLKHHKVPGLLAVPFYSSMSKKEEYLPFTFLMTTTGTNGMAAGNSYEEAVYQALCELIERWAAALVFFEQSTPPTIPDEYLKKFASECQIIDKIEAGGKYRVTIKDFSAGRQLPAVGVIIENVQDSTYRLNVGSDTSFHVALSRCLTEVYQGIRDEIDLKYLSMKIPNELPSYFSSDDEASLNLRYNVYSKFTQDGTGVFPPSLFGSVPTYQFDPTAYRTRGSYKEENDNLIEFFNSQGHPVYIRDVSFLGFPTVYVYIPEVSSLGRKTAVPMLSKPTYNQIEIDKIEDIVYRFKKCTGEDLLNLEASLQTLPAYANVSELLGVQLKETSAGSDISVAFLLALVWFKLGKLGEAARAFSVVYHDSENRIDYYRALTQYTEHLASGKSTEDAREALALLPEQSAEIQEACNDLDNLDALFEKIPLPQCPNCPTCLLKADCKSYRMMEVSRMLYPIMQKAWPDEADTMQA